MLYYQHTLFDAHVWHQVAVHLNNHIIHGDEIVQIIV